MSSLIKPPLSLFQPRLDALAPTPSLDGRIRRAYQYKFPRLDLNPGDLNSVMLRIPAGAHFVVRQIYYSVTQTSNPINLGFARITTSSLRRSNFQWMNDLVPFELFASANSRTPQYLAKPILIEPSTSVMLEVKNTTSSSHQYDVTLVGELIFDMSPLEVEQFMNHAWFMFVATLTPAAASQTTAFFEIRNHPDADFFITHLTTLRYGASNSAVLGPTRILITPASQGEPIMDDWIDTTLICGSYYNLTSVPRGAVAPRPLPEPYQIEANGSLNISAIQPDAPAPADITLALEGVKIFR